MEGVLHKIFGEVQPFSWRGYFLISALILAGYVFLLITEDFPWNSHKLWLSATLFLIAEALWALLWRWRSVVPSNKQGRVGVLVCISGGSRADAQQLKEDFLDEMTAKFRGELAQDSYHVYVMPREMAENFSQLEDAIKEATKKKYHFLLRGLIRKRGGIHYLDLSAHVRHAGIPKDQHDSLKRHLHTAWIPRIKIEEDGFVVEKYQIASDLVSHSVKYVIATAAMVSGDADLAERLLRDLLDHGGPPLSTAHGQDLSKKSKDLLNKIFLRKASIALDAWILEGGAAHLDSITRNLASAFGVHRKKDEFKTLKAIELAIRGDFASAKSVINEISNKKTPVWHANNAFVNGLLGKVDLSYSAYNRLKSERSISAELAERLMAFGDRLYLECGAPQILFLRGAMWELLYENEDLAECAYREYCAQHASELASKAHQVVADRSRLFGVARGECRPAQVSESA